MNLGDLFSQWQAAGIFAYALPFLLIFALIFGILSKINIFGTKDNPNKGVNVLISLAIAFMVLQFNIVSSFFADLFPRFGVALAVILVILIAIGLFTDLGDKNMKWMKWILYVVVLIALILVLSVPLKGLGFTINYNKFFIQNFGFICFGILFLGLIFWAIAGGRKKPSVESVRMPEN